MVEKRNHHGAIIQFTLNEEYRNSGVRPITLFLSCESCGQKYQVLKYPTTTVKNIGTSSKIEPKIEVINNIRQTVMFHHFANAKCEGRFSYQEV